MNRFSEKHHLVEVIKVVSLTDDVGVGRLLLKLPWMPASG
jgi:hypothetical protein